MIRLQILPASSLIGLFVIARFTKIVIIFVSLIFSSVGFGSDLKTKADDL